MSTASLLWGVLFGSIGFGYTLYGRKQKTAVPFVCGLALMALPYLVTNTIALVIVGAALMAAPYFVRV